MEAALSSEPGACTDLSSVLSPAGVSALEKMSAVHRLGLRRLSGARVGVSGGRLGSCGPGGPFQGLWSVVRREG